jgi:NAD+ synthase
MGRELGLPQEIIDAPPTDGLWDDGRTDEDQLGMTYPELENAMRLDQWEREESHLHEGLLTMTKEEKAQLRRYRQIRSRNLHKMQPIPVFKRSV